MKTSVRLFCPMCGWGRPVKYGTYQKTGEIRDVRFDKVDLEALLVVRVEHLHGAGRGSHEAHIDLIDFHYLADAPAELRDQVREQAKKILQVVGTIGGEK